MPLQQNSLSPKEIRNKWYIALESGFFIPTEHHLRVLVLGTKYEYRHSAIGVLCAVSKLGEFLPEPTEHTNGRQKDSIKHIFHLFNGRDLKAANTKYKEYEFRNAPASLLRDLGIAKYRWEINHVSSQHIFAYSNIPIEIKNEIDLIQTYGRYNFSIDNIMTNTAIPQSRKFPILGQLLRTVEKKFAD